MEVIEFRPLGIDPVTLLTSAIEEAKLGETRHVMVISLNKDGVPCIFATRMNRMEYATMSLAAQDLALAALRGQISEEESEPDGGPAS